MTKEELYSKIKEILVDEFEIEEEKIKPEALIADDLDMDSIDAIDLIGKLKEFIPGGKIDPAIFKSVKTLQDVLDQIFPLLAK